MIKSIDHIAIAVKDLEKSLEQWRDALGFEVKCIEEIAERNVRVAEILFPGSPSLELVSAMGEDSPVANFVDERGEGIHHFCLEVEDVQKAMDKLKEKGLRFVHDSPQKGAEGSRIAFLHPSNLNGVLIELKEKQDQK